MTPHLVNRLSNQEQDLDEVWAWYELQRMLIGDEADRTMNALQSGNTELPERYDTLSPDELDSLFREQRTELDNIAMLLPLAATEAALRIDHILKVSRNKKDAISKECSILYRESKLRINLEDQLLEV